MRRTELRSIKRAAGEGNDAERAEAQRMLPIVSLAIFFMRLGHWFISQGRHKEGQEAHQKAKDILKDA